MHLHVEQQAEEPRSSAPAKARPLLRWAGSKRGSLDQLMPLWSGRHHRYVEPFAGSASLFFALNPPAAILSDSNPHLVRAYLAVRENASLVFEIYETLPRTSEYFYSIRQRAFETDCDFTHAARFIYLNRNCFNGLYRTNKKGEFNVPFSSKRVPKNLDRADFLKSADRLASAEVICRDFERTILEHARPGDLVYLDPPFAVQNVRTFTQYGPANFGLADLERLQRCLKYLNSSGVDFVVSYADCPEARDLFCEWTVRSHLVTRHISGFAANRKKSGEIVVTNVSA